MCLDWCWRFASAREGARAAISLRQRARPPRSTPVTSPNLHAPSDPVRFPFDPSCPSSADLEVWTEKTTTKHQRKLIKRKREVRTAPDWVGTRAEPADSQSYTSQGIGRQGAGSFCTQSLCFSTVPCRPVPLLAHFRDRLRRQRRPASSDPPAPRLKSGVMVNEVSAGCGEDHSAMTCFSIVATQRVPTPRSQT